MPTIELAVQCVEYRGDRYLRLQDSLLKPDTIQQGELALYFIQDGKVWQHHEVVGAESEVNVLGDETLTVDVADLVATMLDTLDRMFAMQSDEPLEERSLKKSAK